jgi:hypothetical protein
MNITQFSRRFRVFTAAFALIFVIGLSTETFAQRSEATYLITTNDTIMGLAPDQRLILHFYNPTRETVAGPHVRVYDGAGDLLLSYDHTPIGAGRFDSFTINYTDLELRAGENGTVRRQIRVATSMVFTGPETEAALFRPSWELVNATTGEAILIGMLLPAVQKVR